MSEARLSEWIHNNMTFTSGQLVTCKCFCLLRQNENSQPLCKLPRCRTWDSGPRPLHLGCRQCGDLSHMHTHSLTSCLISIHKVFSSLSPACSGTLLTQIHVQCDWEQGSVIYLAIYLAAFFAPFSQHIYRTRSSEPGRAGRWRWRRPAGDPTGRLRPPGRRSWCCTWRGGSRGCSCCI